MQSQKTLEYDDYIKVLYNILFDPHAIKLKTGKEVSIPSLYKFCFDVFDIGDKDFICEHDLFQLMSQVNTSKPMVRQRTDQNQEEGTPPLSDFKDEEEEKKIGLLDKQAPIEYTELQQPVISKSTFVDALAYDVSYLFLQLEEKTAPEMKKDKEQHAVSSGKTPGALPSKPEKLRKSSKGPESGQAGVKLIFQNLKEHLKSNNELQANNIERNPKVMEQKKLLSKRFDIFSHQNPYIK